MLIDDEPLARRALRRRRVVRGRRLLAGVVRRVAGLALLRAPLLALDAAQPAAPAAKKDEKKPPSNLSSFKILSTQ
jgi:hypothetical protein